MEATEPSVELLFNAKKKAETHNASKPAVVVRHFVNTMNDYVVPRRGSEEAVAQSQLVPLTRVTAPRVALWVPSEFLEHSFPHSSAFLKAAIELKDEVVQATWRRNAPTPVSDPTMYTGVLGSAMLCFKAFLTTQSAADLVLCSDIVDSCCAAAPTAPDNVTFLRGQAGIYALGAVAAHFRGDNIRRDFFLHHFNRITERRELSMGPADEGGGLPCELLNGRVGFLYAALFINRYLGEETVPWCMMGPIVDAVLASGQAHATPECPLMYPWRSRRFWGASHGLAGIIQCIGVMEHRASPSPYAKLLRCIWSHRNGDQRRRQHLHWFGSGDCFGEWDYAMELLAMHMYFGHCIECWRVTKNNYFEPDNLQGGYSNMASNYYQQARCMEVNIGTLYLKG